MSMSCDPEKGCSSVQVLIQKQDNAQKQVDRHEVSISAIHKRLDTILIGVVLTLGAGVISLLMALSK